MSHLSAAVHCMLGTKRPRKRKADPHEESSTLKKHQVSLDVPRHISPAVSIPTHTIRARIFRNGRSYTPPVTLDTLPAAPHQSSSSSIPVSSSRGRPQSPSTRSHLPDPISGRTYACSRTPPSALQEAWLLDFPPGRLLTDLQVVDRRVRLLLPKNATIVLPSSTAPCMTAREFHVPQPDPSLWVGRYVSVLFIIFNF
jgi:hypothetical protein